jgi:hypothetical protein
MLEQFQLDEHEVMQLWALVRTVDPLETSWPT